MVKKKMTRPQTHQLLESFKLSFIEFIREAKSRESELLCQEILNVFTVL